jgi:hypothetical protein
VLLETEQTESIFLAISTLPEAASETVLPISLAVAACSSTALAMIPDMSFILLIILEIDVIESIAPLTSFWILLIYSLISSVALDV